jgi:hypothetical protein
VKIRRPFDLSALASAVGLQDAFPLGELGFFGLRRVADLAPGFGEQVVERFIAEIANLAGLEGRNGRRGHFLGLHRFEQRFA